MVSTDKLIKVGVKYSDQYFEQLKALYIRAYANSMSFEEFLDETSDYSIGNPLEAGGFKDTLSDLIVSSTNDIRFSRPAQKALMQTIIRNTTGELIVNVGDDIKHGVRNIVGRGYRNGKLNHKRVADEITHELDGINHKRARVIARTEIKRAQITSNYTVALERGANAYKYKCGAKPCDICKKDCGKTFPITDLEHLPPRHPSCMCGVTFFKDPNLPLVEKPTTTSESTSTGPKTKPVTTDGEIQLSGSTFESIFKKKPKVYQETYEHIDANFVSRKHNLTTYDYGDIKLSFEDGSILTHKELVEHISSLPKHFEKTYAKRITIYNTPVKNVGGVWKVTTQECAVYFQTNKVHALNTLTHEMAHALDIPSKKSKIYSDPKVYEKIFEADNKLYEYKGPTGRIRKPKKFPTEYAGKSYAKYKRKKILDKLFVEDFAESSMLYLNPSTHKKFVKDFPNRAGYLESIYGKPVFKKDSVLSRELANEKKLSDTQAKARNLKELKTKKFNSLTREELNIELKKVLGDNERVKKYHAMQAEIKKLKSIQDAISLEDISILTDNGWTKSQAKKIMDNPNKFLATARQKRNEISKIVNQIDELVKENLDLNTVSKPTNSSTSKSKPKTKPKKDTKTKPKSETKTENKSKQKIDPSQRAKVKDITYEEYSGFDFKSAKTIKYEDGTTIKFKKYGDPDYPGQTLDEVTINGKTYKYKDNDVYDHFKYQDSQLTKEELNFADEFIEHYGTYAGKELNSMLRGKLSKKDLKDLLEDEDDVVFKWLVDNYEKYNKILDKSSINEDVISMRIQAVNYVPEGATTIQDKSYTSSSVGISRTDLMDCFGNARNMGDNWTYITVTPKGTTGARFQGNSIARNYGSLDDDFERELTYKPNMKFDILLRDDENKIMILQPH